MWVYMYVLLFPERVHYTLKNIHLKFHLRYCSELKIETKQSNLAR